MAACRAGDRRLLLLALTVWLVPLLLRFRSRPPEPAPPLTERRTEEAPSLTPAQALAGMCLKERLTHGGLAPDVRRKLGELCRRIGRGRPETVAGCRKAISYDAIGRTGNLMSLYGIIYSLSHTYGAAGYLESGAWSKLHKYFPNLSLKPMKDAPADVKWEDISYGKAKDKLACHPGDDAKPRYFRIVDWPNRNGIDVFHPFKTEMRREFTFSTELREEAQDFLRQARGNRTSVTFIGFHVRRTDFVKYVREKYGRTLPDIEYYDRALYYYRRRFPDALFIVCSDDIDYVTKELKPKENSDIVIAGNRNTVDPGRDMALLSACNHSVVTVGTYGFWGAYLAGGTVLMPDEKEHLASSDGSVSLHVVQKAGANNYVKLWS